MRVWQFMFAIERESATTRKAGGVNLPELMGGEKQMHICALIAAVVIRREQI